MLLYSERTENTSSLKPNLDASKRQEVETLHCRKPTHNRQWTETEKNIITLQCLDDGSLYSVIFSRSFITFQMDLYIVHLKQFSQQ